MPANITAQERAICDAIAAVAAGAGPSARTTFTFEDARNLLREIAETIDMDDLSSTAAALGASLIGLQDSAADLAGATVEAGVAELAARGRAAPYSARYVMTTNVADLASFTVLQDGVTGVANDLVLLAAQTTGSQAGLYAIGTVAAGVAPLTRAGAMPAAEVLPFGTTCFVEAGTLFAGSRWYAKPASGTVTVGTTAHDWYPESVTQTITLVAGTKTVTNIPIRSTTLTGVSIVRRVANTSTLTVGGYHPTVAGADGVTAGLVGTGQVVIQATVGAGTINAVDISTLSVTITN